MQIGDSLVGVNHCDRWARFVHSSNRGFDGVTLGFRQRSNGGCDVAPAVVRVGPDRVEHVGMLGKHVGEEYPHCMTEDDRVRDLHHCCFEV